MLLISFKMLDIMSLTETEISHEKIYKLFNPTPINLMLAYFIYLRALTVTHIYINILSRSNKRCPLILLLFLMVLLPFYFCSSKIYLIIKLISNDNFSLIVYFTALNHDALSPLSECITAYSLFTQRRI